MSRFLKLCLKHLLQFFLKASTLSPTFFIIIFHKQSLLYLSPPPPSLEGGWDNSVDPWPEKSQVLVLSHHTLVLTNSALSNKMIYFKVRQYDSTVQYVFSFHLSSAFSVWCSHS